MNDTQPRPRRSRMAMRAQNAVSSAPDVDVAAAGSADSATDAVVSSTTPAAPFSGDGVNMVSPAVPKAAKPSPFFPKDEGTSPYAPIEFSNVNQAAMSGSNSSVSFQGSQNATAVSGSDFSRTSPYAPLREKEPFAPSQSALKPSQSAGTSPYAPIKLPENLAQSSFTQNQEELSSDSRGTFAPPPKMDSVYPSFSNAASSAASKEEFKPLPRPEDGWDDDEAIQSGFVYHTQSDVDNEAVSKKSHITTFFLILLCAVMLLAGLAILFQDQIASLVNYSYQTPVPEATPVPTAAPKTEVQAYHASESEKASEAAEQEITDLMEEVPAEQYLVTEGNVVMRSPAKDGLYDFYVFSDTGKLLCYFDKLGEKDFLSIGDNLYYVAQYPYLITSSGKAAVNLKQISASIGDNFSLDPMYNGWSIVTNAEAGEKNYINTDGNVLSSLWFSKAYPFTGLKTVAYVDTKVAGDSQYLLYVLSADGTEERWNRYGKITDVVASACGAAYMDSGEFFFLEDLASPVCTTDDVSIYLNCDAVVLRNPENGKYALYVHGQQQYNFEYDSIRPVESDLNYRTIVNTGAGGICTLYTADKGYPLPKAYSFVLEKDGSAEYVSLSADSVYPIALIDTF